MTSKRSNARQMPEVAYLAALALLVLIYLATVLPHLADDPIAGGDEGWIISASAKLATKGVFGSDLFSGFYGAQDYYFFNLPMHHLVLAGVFKLFGIGLAQARMVSVVYGLFALLLTYAIGRKLAGNSVAILAATLLVLLRLNLTPFSGLTLTDLGATTRYDLIAVPYGLTAVLILMHAGPNPRMLAVLGAGFLVGLAALTQFIGAFFGLPLALYLLSLALPWSKRILLVAVLTAAALLPLFPYVTYISNDLDDFRGQARTVEQQTDLTSPAFYWRQLTHERDRYAIGTDLKHTPSGLSDLVSRPSARLALLALAPLSMLWLLWRGRDDLGYRLLGLTFVLLVLQLALFESTKRFEYWVVAVPFLCIAIADVADAAWQWQPGPGSRRWLLHAVVGAVFALFALEGLAVAARDVKNARHAPSYTELGKRLEAQIEPGSIVVGDNRLWPAMPDVRLRSLLLIFYETNPRISRDQTTDIFGAFNRIKPDYIILSPLSREILTKLTPTDADAFQRYIDTRTDKVATVDYPGYGATDILRVRHVGLAETSSASP